MTSPGSKDNASSKSPVRIAVIGAGVIGSVYAARLADAGHHVTLVARGERLAMLRTKGLRARSEAGVVTPKVSVIEDGSTIPVVDMLIVAVRATQLRPVLGAVAASSAPAVVFLQHLGPYAEEVTAAIGADRVVFAFPGIGGFIHEDGMVEYVEIGAQATTIDAKAPKALSAQEVIASTGMHTAMEQDMAAWLATHEVFVASIGAGILVCGGDAAALSRDRIALRQVVRAVHEGFVALEALDIRVTPSALRVLFLRMPRWFAAAYWRRALKGPVGTVALAPHTHASRNDEFALLCANVLDNVASKAHTPSLARLLEPFNGSTDARRAD